MPPSLAGRGHYGADAKKNPAGGAGLFNARRPGGSGGSWAAYQLVVVAAGMVQTFPGFEVGNPMRKKCAENAVHKTVVAAKCLKSLVAGSGIEPPTYGL